MALITSDCGATRSLIIKWPYSPRIACPSEPIIYPYISEFVQYLHQRKISSFLVTIAVGESSVILLTPPFHPY